MFSIDAGASAGTLLRHLIEIKNTEKSNKCIVENLFPDGIFQLVL